MIDAQSALILSNRWKLGGASLDKHGDTSTYDGDVLKNVHWTVMLDFTYILK